MSATVTTTNTLDITLGTSTAEGVGTDITWKLNNPLSGLSFANVTAAFNGVMGICNPALANGEAIVAIKKAKTVQTVKTVEELL